MCEECGCGLGAHSDTERDGSRQDHPDALPAHDHGPSTHAHSPESGSGTHVLQLRIQRSLLERNQVYAERNRGYFKARGLLVLNFVSAPGSGKTELIARTAEYLQPKLRVGAVVGDLATDNDAQRLRRYGIPVVQISTGTLCHLDAEMVSRALDSMGPDPLDLLIIENVGNLVCPAAYDLGENLRVVLLSVTEGEDKPVKYPPLFHSAHVAVVTKMDLAEVADFDRGLALKHLARVSHHARIFEVSARTGEGMEEWSGYLSNHPALLRRRDAGVQQA